MRSCLVLLFIALQPLYAFEEYTLDLDLDYGYGYGAELHFVTFLPTGHDEFIKQAIEQHNIDDIVLLAPDVSYSQALQEMCEADGLILLPAANCNQQIPAKIYEYMASRAGCN